MENLGNNLKKLFTGATLVTTAATGLAKEAPKSTEQLASNTQTEQVMTAQQQMEAAQASLSKSQVEFQNNHTRLVELFASNKFVSDQLKEISDMPAKISLFARNFTNGQTEDIKDSTDLQTFIQEGIKFARDVHSPLFKEMQAIKVLSGGVLGELTAQEGAAGQKDVNGNTMVNAGTVVSKDQTERTFLVGENNITDRMIADAITFYVKQAALETIKKANQNFEQAPLAQKDLDALKAVSFQQAQDIHDSTPDQLADNK